MKPAEIDASVVLEWYLSDEKLGDKALGFPNRFISDDQRTAEKLDRFCCQI
jgi:hypothetical protein